MNSHVCLPPRAPLSQLVPPSVLPRAVTAVHRATSSLVGPGHAGPVRSDRSDHSGHRGQEVSPPPSQGTWDRGLGAAQDTQMEPLTERPVKSPVRLGPARGHKVTPGQGRRAALPITASAVPSSPCSTGKRPEGGEASAESLRPRVHASLCHPRPQGCVGPTGPPGGGTHNHRPPPEACTGAGASTRLCTPLGTATLSLALMLRLSPCRKVTQRPA